MASSPGSDASDTESSSSGHPAAYGSVVDDDTLETWTGELTEALDSIETDGAFAWQESWASYPSPGLQVGEQDIPLPLVPRDAGFLRSHCRQAPFGRGEETVVDAAVRRTWELDSCHFQIANPEWDAHVNMALRKAAAALGMPSDARAEPYKLLLYDPGSFFHRHKDSEKAPGMIGTLVICLPSKHEGGDVRLSHAGKEQTFATGPLSSYHVTCLAWYSDVTHEIEEVKSGNRLVLTYNIVQPTGERATAACLSEQLTHVDELMTRWRTSFPDVERLIYCLEHKYSDTSLSANILKGRDRALFNVLRDVCRERGFHLLLAKMDKTKHPDPSCDEEAEDEVTLNRVITCEGVVLTSGMSAEIKDILGGNPYEGRDADSEDEEEFTGNEGRPTAQRYHDAVLMMVPKEHLDQFIRDTWHTISAKRFVNLALTELRANPLDPVKLLAAQKVVEAALRGERTEVDLPLMLDAIWRLELEPRVGPLHQLVLKAAVRKTERQAKVPLTHPSRAFAALVKPLAEIADEFFLKPGMDTVDWSVYLGTLVTASAHNQEAKEVLDAVYTNLGRNEVKESFKEWASSIDKIRVESKGTLGISDFASIASLLGAPATEDSSWISSTLIPRIRHKVDTQLVQSVTNLLAKQAKDGMRPFVDAKKLVEDMLAHPAMSTLALTPEDLRGKDREPKEPRPFNEPMSSNYWSNQHTEGNSRKALAVIVDVADNCLYFGLQDHAQSLLLGACLIFLREQQRGQQHGDAIHTSIMAGCWTTFLQPCIATLEKHHFTGPTQPVQTLLVEYLLRHVVVNPPRYPSRQLPGWAYEPRRCGARMCEPCDDLNRFLQSKDLVTAGFVKNQHYREHIQALLPPAVFQCSTARSSAGRAVLSVQKLGTEWQTGVRTFWAQVKVIEDKLVDFHGDSVHKILGDELYNNLVLLDKIKPKTAETVPQHPAGGFGGGGIVSSAAPALGIHGPRLPAPPASLFHGASGGGALPPAAAARVVAGPVLCAPLPPTPAANPAHYRPVLGPSTGKRPAEEALVNPVASKACTAEVIDLT